MVLLVTEHMQSACVVQHVSDPREAGLLLKAPVKKHGLRPAFGHRRCCRPLSKSRSLSRQNSNNPSLEDFPAELRLIPTS